MNILIPMAGEGSRFKVEGYDKPKPLIQVCGIPMIKKAVESLNIEGNYIFVIRQYENEKVNRELLNTLKKIKEDCKIITIKELTRGSAETCLLASNFIDNEDPLIITNCDQVMEWDSNEFCSKFSLDKDGIVVTYDTDTPKNSYVSLDREGNAIEFAEKRVISKNSLNGIHYWRKGKDFVRSAKKMIDENIRVNNEFYIAPTYNELIKEGKQIIIHKVENNQHWPVGTPEDLRKYENIQNGRNA